jgi:hypothetical protein
MQSAEQVRLSQSMTSSRRSLRMAFIAWAKRMNHRQILWLLAANSGAGHASVGGCRFSLFLD